MELENSPDKHVLSFSDFWFFVQIKSWRCFSSFVLPCNTINGQFNNIIQQMSSFHVKLWSAAKTESLESRFTHLIWYLFVWLFSRVITLSLLIASDRLEGGGVYEGLITIMWYGVYTTGREGSERLSKRSYRLK